MGTNTNEDKIQSFTRQTADQLRAQLDGLTDAQAEESRARSGTNHIPGVEKDTFVYRLRRAFLNPFSVVLMVLAVISCLVDVILASPSERSYTTCTIIALMLFSSGCVRLTQELKSKETTDKLLRLVDARVMTKRNGSWDKIDAGELVVGDIVRLAAGERVPADIRLTRVQDCFLSESAITGESEVEEKTADPMTQMPQEIRDYKNIAFCGTTVVNGSFEGLVIAVGNDTLYGAIAPGQNQRKQGYDQGTGSIAWVLIRFMAFLVPIVFVASGLTKGNWLSSFLFSLSIAVGLTPELLPMVITACLAKGSFNMIERKTVVKNVNAMQGFGNMDVLCVDKTGTLTEDTLLLEYYMDILGNEDQNVLNAAYLNSFYHSGICNHLDAAILKVDQMPKKASYYAQLTQSCKKLDELPFDYTRKIASVLLEHNTENVLIVKGGIDAILHHCRYAFYKGKRIEMDAESSASVHAVVDEMLEDGMKVLAVAAKSIGAKELHPSDEQDLTLIGYVAFFDAPKKTASSALQKLHTLHVATKVLTGDNLDVAISVCRRLGMDISKVMTGKELDLMTDNEIQIRVEETLIFAELSPAQKAQIVELLQSNGHTVGFLADGMNDLPAVMKSDVGISVDTAVPSVKECADVILLKKDLNVLEAGITEGRRAFANMSKYIKITASSNLGNIVAIVLASIFMPFFPMTSIQILLLNLLYDILCLVLPWDRVDPEMIEKPLEWSGKDLSRFMSVFGPISTVFDVLTFLFLFFFLCPLVCGGNFDLLSEPLQMRFVSVFQTGWFLESMWSQVLILHSLRTGKLPFLESKPSMPFLLVTLLGVSAFTLLAVTPIGELIGLTALPPVYFIFLVSIVLCYLLVVTAVKRLYLKHYHSLI